MHPEDFAAEVGRYEHWLYEWDLGNGILIESADPNQRIYQEPRGRIVFDAARKALGRGEHSLVGKSVLDVGCSEGWFSVEAAKRGATRVVGIEPRAEKVEQARLVARALGVTTVEYRCMSVWDIEDLAEKFDVVLFVGVLYHLDRPYEALRLLREVTNELLVIDTQIVDFPHPILAMKEESSLTPTNAFENALVMVPSDSAVQLMLDYAGFGSIERAPRPKRGEWGTSNVTHRYRFNRHATYTAKPDPGSTNSGDWNLSLERLQNRLFRSSHQRGFVWRSMINFFRLAADVLKQRT